MNNKAGGDKPSASYFAIYGQFIFTARVSVPLAEKVG